MVTLSRRRRHTATKITCIIMIGQSIGIMLMATISCDAFVVRAPQYAVPATSSSLLQLPLSTSRLHMVSPSTLMEKLPSPTVIEAVSKAKDGKVIASDVAASAGVSLQVARKDLTTLASLSRGDIAVDQDGELIYSFPDNLQGVLASNSAKYKAMQTFKKAWPAAFWFLRVSFGVALLASVLAIFSTIFFLQSSSSSDDDRRRDDRGGGGGMNFGYMWGPSPFDFFYYRPYGYYGAYGTSAKDPEEMGFLESVFSYVFGDGDPNAGLEERRLAMAAAAIRASEGAVTAEQLAPFTDEAPAPGKESTTYVDESYVLPIVSALNGEPQVTEDGEIVYVFPELQMSASPSSSKSKSSLSKASGTSKEALILKRIGLRPDSSASDIKRLLMGSGIPVRGALEREDLIQVVVENSAPLTPSEEMQIVDSDPSLLQERTYPFSLASGLNKFLAGGLGVVNLLGALYLGNMLGQYALYGVKLPAYYGLVQSAFPFLLSYAVLFNVIPLVRKFWIDRQNTKIEERNKVRRAWRDVLSRALPGTRIGQKLAAASKLRTKMRRIGASTKDIIFDTSKPVEDIREKKAKTALEEFDKLLGSEDAFQ